MTAPVPSTTQKRAVHKPKEKRKVRSQYVGKGRKHRSSTRAEKMNYEVEKATPEFIEEHTTRLKNLVTAQIKGGEMSVQMERDPRKKKEMEMRIRAARRLQGKLETVNPQDESTWFFIKKPSEDPEVAGNNDMFPVEGKEPKEEGVYSSDVETVPED